MAAINKNDDHAFFIRDPQSVGYAFQEWADAFSRRLWPSRLRGLRRSLVCRIFRSSWHNIAYPVPYLPRVRWGSCSLDVQRFPHRGTAILVRYIDLTVFPQRVLDDVSTLGFVGRQVHRPTLHHENPRMLVGYLSQSIARASVGVLAGARGRDGSAEMKVYRLPIHVAGIGYTTRKNPQHNTSDFWFPVSR